MSVDLQTAHGHEQFGVNSTQFEEIVPNHEERSSRSNPTSKIEKMEKNSGSDERSNDKDKNKEPPKSPLNSTDSSDGNSSYEDDFEESEAAIEPKQKAVSRKSSARRSQGHISSRSPEHSTVKSPSIISSKKSKITKRFNPYQSPRSSDAATSRQTEKSWAKPKNKSANVKVSRFDQTVVDRVLSAKRNKVVKLESRLTQLLKELTMEREENKTLRQIHYRQEKELIKVNNEEAGLPQLIRKHTTEVTSLRETNRRLHDTIGQQESKIGDLDKKILKLQDKNKHYRELCEMKNLPEREESQKKLTQAEKNLEKRDAEISKLQRMLTLKEKTHSRQIKEQTEKLRQTDAKLKDMEENCTNLQVKNEGMKTQLDYLNIYQRQIVLKEKTKVSPEGPPKMAALPAPKRPKPKKTNNNNKNKNNENNNKKTVTTKENTVNKKPDSIFLTAQSDTASDKELDKSGNEAGKNDKLLSITDGTYVLDMSDLNKGRTLAEDELTKEKERRKKEEFERSLREEDERLKKEKEESGRIKKEEEERLEREQAERETKWREDSARRAREEEERRKESARRARQEEEKRKAEEAKEKEREKREDSFFEDEESRKKKELLLARMKAIDNAKGSDEDAYHSDNKRLSSGKSGDDPIKSHGFRKADENLHNGLPAVAKESSITSPPVSVKSDPDSVVGIPRYKPTLLGRGNLTKKPNQFGWLEENKKPAVNTNKVKPNDDFNFGDYSPSMSDTKKKPANLNGDIFGTGFSRKPARGRRGHGDNGFDFGERRGSGDKPKNNLSFLSDDFGGKRKGELPSISPTNNNEPLLPRRRKAQERGGPAISSAFDDNLDDDIEELAL